MVSQVLSELWWVDALKTSQTAYSLYTEMVTYGSSETIAAAMRTSNCLENSGNVKNKINITLNVHFVGPELTI